MGKLALLLMKPHGAAMDDEEGEGSESPDMDDEERSTAQQDAVDALAEALGIDADKIDKEKATEALKSFLSLCHYDENDEG